MNTNNEQKTCKDCESFLGGGDWDLCCKEHHDPKEYPFGFLCYENTPVCEKFKPKKRNPIQSQTNEIIKIFNEASLEEKLEIRNVIDNISKKVNTYIAENTYVCSICWKYFYIGEAEGKFEHWTEIDQSISSDYGKPIPKDGYRYYCPHCKSLLTEHYNRTLLERKTLGKI